MIDPGDPRTPLRQIAERLRAQILAGQPPGGYPLPAEAALAASYRVNKLTVHRALLTLQAEGLVVIRASFGTYVRDRREPHVVRLSEGTVSARHATAREAARFGVAAGWPVLVVERAGRRMVVPADRVRVEIGAPGDVHRR